MSKKATIAEVAKRARVSEATVSRVLNNPAIVKPELIVRVNNAMRDLHYLPNRHARLLAGIESRTVGIILFNEIDQFFRSPFWAEAISSIYTRLMSANLQCNLIFQKDVLSAVAHTINKSDYLRFLNSRHVDSFIVLGFPPIEVLEVFEACRTPIILWGRPIKPRTTVKYVESDNESGAAIAAEYLLSKKRKRIALIAARDDSTGSADRVQGFVQSLARHGVLQSESLIVRGDFTYRSGREAMRTLLSRKVSFDAVFAINDDMACGAIEVLQEEGFKVPEDISVVGFDGAFSENPTNERLTTIAIDYSKISEVLVSKILRLMEGKGAKSELVPVSLRIRQTA